MRCLWLACLAFLFSGRVSAQATGAQDAGLASLEALRARVAARGFVRTDVGGPIPREEWCAAPPCAEGADRLVLHVRDAALVEVHVLEHGVGEGFTLDGSWQASGAFGFRFTRGQEVVDLGWELAYEPPGMHVGFTARDTAEVVALDPSDGAHAFALWIRRELARHLTSAESLRDTALARRAARRDAVALGLETAASVRVGGPERCLVERSFPEGTGMFDTCTYRRASPEERRAALAALDARLANERRLIRRHFRAWHRAIRASLGP